MPRHQRGKSVGSDSSDRRDSSDLVIEAREERAVTADRKITAVTEGSCDSGESSEGRNSTIVVREESSERE